MTHATRREREARTASPSHAIDEARRIEHNRSDRASIRWARPPHTRSDRLCKGVTTARQPEKNDTLAHSDGAFLRRTAILRHSEALVAHGLPNELPLAVSDPTER